MNARTIVERRREIPRVDMLQPGELVIYDGSSSKIEFLDLSASGFKIRHQEQLMVGDIVTVTSAKGFKALAEVKWVIDQLAGGVFMEPPEALV